MRTRAGGRRSQGIAARSHLAIAIIVMVALMTSVLGPAVAQDSLDPSTGLGAAAAVADPSATPTDRPTPDPTPRPTPDPTPRPTPDPTPTPRADATAQQRTTPDPTDRPTPDVTDEPSPSPTDVVLASPTDRPGAGPTLDATPGPASPATPEATDPPTGATDAPDATATAVPDASPSPSPFVPDPSAAPSVDPGASPDIAASPMPSDTPSASAPPVPSAAPSDTDSLIVRFRAGVPASDQQDLIARVGGTQTDAYGALRIRVVSVPADRTAATTRDLRDDPRVEAVEVDHVRAADGRPSDPAYASQWNLKQMRWARARRTVTPTGHATVAVLDTGIDAGHADLLGRVVGAWSAFGTDATTDQNGHGTAMAGIAAADTNDGVGIAGVAYGNVDLLSVQVLDATGAGADSDIIGGVLWATDHGADVILMAFSNPGSSAALQLAIDYAWSHGVILVAATGNDGTSFPTYPAGSRHVMGVSGTDEHDALADMSNSGTDTFIAAPGVAIPAPWPDGGWTTVSGTSAAAAEVAGAAALLRAIDPNAANGVVVGRLARTAEPAGSPGQTGNGRIDLYRAVRTRAGGSVDPAGAAGGGPFVGPYTAAATKYWVGCADTNWSTNGNWSTSSTAACSGGAPTTGATTAAGSGDTATITTGRASYPNVASGGITIQSLTINGGGSLTVAGGTLSMTGTMTVNGSLVVSSGTLSVTGNWTVGSGDTLTQSGGTILSAGTFTLSGTFTQSAGTLHMAAAMGTIPTDNITLKTDGAINQSGTGVIDVRNYTAASGSGTTQSGGTFRLYRNLSNSGTYSATGGTFEVAGTGTKNGAFAATGTTQFFDVLVDSGVTARFSATAFVFTVRGGWTVNGTASLTSRATTVTFDGAGAQTIGGSANTIFRNLTINKPGASVTLARNTTVATASAGTGTLTLTAGSIATGTSTLIVATGGTVARTSGYVEGNLQKQVATGTNVARTFEVGTGTTYAPATVTFASVTTAGNLTVSTTAGQHPQIGTSSIVASADVARYWTMTSATAVFTTAGIVFTFANPGDITGGDPLTYIVQRYDSGWSTPTIGTRTATTTQATGMTAFGSYAIGAASTAAASGDGTLVVSPTTVTAGSTNNTLTFTFSAPATEDFSASSALSFVIPAGWTTPQATNPANPGYLTAIAGSCTPGNPGISGTGPWTITVVQACPHGTSFTVAYGADSSTNVTAPAAAGTATFPAQSRFGAAGVFTTLGSGSPAVSVVPGVAAKLQVLLPGESAAPGTPSGKTGTPTATTAGASMNVTVNAVDANWNVVTSATPTVTITSSDANATLPANAALVGGTRTFPVTFRTAGSRTVTATYVSGVPPVSAGTSASVVVSAGPVTKLQVLLPGETAAPGTVSGKTGSPTGVTAGAAVTVTVNAVDANWNVVASATPTVAISSSDPNATLPADAALVAGTRSLSVTLKTAGSRTITATDVSGVPPVTAGTSAAVSVNAGAAVGLQVLLPGETAAPGTVSGKTGTPTAITAGASVTVTVNAVDANWNISSVATPIVTISSSDPNATLPADDDLVAGTQGFIVSLPTAGSRTIAATYVSGVPPVTAGTSAAVTVNAGAAVGLQVLLPGETAAPGSVGGKTGTPTGVVAGAVVTVTINAVDAEWNVVATATPTVAITSSDASATLPANTALVGGTRSLSVTLKTAGSRTVTATSVSGSPSLPAGTSAPIVVDNGAATHFSVVAPSSTTAGASMSVVVTALDAFGNVDTDYVGTVHFTSTDAAATLPADSTLVAGTGTRAFSATLRTAGSRTITARDTVTSSITGTTGAITVDPAAAANVSLVLTPSTIIANGAATSTATATITDGSGNGLAGRTVTITTSGDVTIGAVSYAGSGVYRATITASVTAGNETIMATDVTDAIATTAVLTESPGPVAKLQVLLPGETAAPGTVSGKTGTPTGVTAGTLVNATIRAVDANWNLVSSATPTVAITSSDVNATLPANAALVAGTRTFNVTLKTAGSRTVTATDVAAVLAAGTSAPVTVVAGAAIRLQVLLPGETAAPGSPTGKSGSPTGVVAGSPVTVTVNAVDANWNLVPTATLVVAITSNDPSATLPGNAALAAGTRPFSVTFTAVGTHTVTASYVSGSPSVSPGTSAGVAVSPGPAVSLTVSAPPGTTAGSPLSVTVTAKDAFGNTATGYAGIVHFTSTDGTAVLPADAALVPGTGVRTVSLTLTTAGNRTVSATDTVTGTITGTSPVIAVTNAAAAAIDITLSPTSIVANQVATSTATAIVSDLFGNPVAGETVTMATSGDVTVGLVTGVGNGTYIATITASRTAGTETITATDGVLGDFAILTETPGPAARLQVLLPGETAAPGTLSGKTGTPTGITAGTTINVTVNVVDLNWNLVPSVTPTVAITSSDPNASLPANAALVAGTRTFSVTLKTAGARTVTAADLAATLTAGTSAAVAVAVGAATRLQVLLPGEIAAPGSTTGKSGTPSDITAGVPVTVSVNAVDANWNLVASATPTVAITSSDGAATLPGNAALVAGTRTFSVTLRTAGSRTVTAGYVSGSPPVSAGTSSAVDVNADTATHFSVVAPASTVAGAAFDITVSALDAYGNIDTDYAGTITFTSTDGAAVLPADTDLPPNSGTDIFTVVLKTAGGRTITATDTADAAITGASGAIAVSPAAAFNISLSLTPRTIVADGVSTSAAAVTVTDSFGNGLAGKTVTLTTSGDVTFGAVSYGGSGVYNATITASKTAGNETITATDITDGSIHATATLTETPGPVTKLQVLLPGETAAPGTVSGKTGTPTAITAGASVTVTVNAVDANWNLVASATPTVAFSSSDPNATLPANAALIGGTRSLSVTLKTVGSRTVTATDVAAVLTAGTSASVTVSAGAATKLQMLLPGETAAPGTGSGKTGTPTAITAGTSVTVTVNAVDANWNTVTSATPTVAFSSSDPNATLPANTALIGGTRSLSITLKTAGSRTVTATDVAAFLSAGTSASVTVSAGAATKLQVLLPGETAAPGTASGRTGSPTGVTAGTSVTVTVNAVDTNWNLVASATPTVSISSSDPNATLPANAPLIGGTRSFSITLKTAGSRTVTATDVAALLSVGTSASVVVSAGIASKLQVLLPGETAAPGTVSGKTGTPTAITAGASVTATVNAVDANWNLVASATSTVAITSSDGNATLPANAALVAGTRTFSVTLRTAGSRTITATDVAAILAAGTSASVTVAPGPVTKLQVLLPGEAAAPGTVSGKTGTPTGVTAGASVNITVSAVDANWNVVTSATPTVSITSSDPNATLPANTALIAGTRSLSVTLKTAGSRTATATDIAAVLTAGTSAPVTVSAGAASKLQVLLPGEAAAPGTVSGKTGTPTAIIAGTSVTATVNAVDANWNLVVSATPTVAITSSDPNATLPANAALVGRHPDLHRHPQDRGQPDHHRDRCRRRAHRRHQRVGHGVRRSGDQAPGAAARRDRRSGHRVGQDRQPERPGRRWLIRRRRAGGRCLLEHRHERDANGRPHQQRPTRHPARERTARIGDAHLQRDARDGHEPDRHGHRCRGRPGRGHERVTPGVGHDAVGTRLDPLGSGFPGQP